MTILGAEKDSIQIYQMKRVTLSGIIDQMHGLYFISVVGKL